MTKLKLTLIFVLLSSLSFAQRKEYYYFDSQGNPANSSNYYYYRVLQYNAEGSITSPITTYFATGKIDNIFYSDKANIAGIKTAFDAERMGMNNGKRIEYSADGELLYTIYYRNGEKYNVVYGDDRSSGSSSSSSSGSTVSTLVGAAAVVAGLYGLYKAFTGDGDSSSSGSSSGSTRSVAPAVRSMDNVEIIGYNSKKGLATMGQNWVYLVIRNKNSYDVYVNVNFMYDGEWGTRNEDTNTYKLKAGESKEIESFGRAWNKVEDVRIVSVR